MNSKNEDMNDKNEKMRLGLFLHGMGHHIAGWRHPSTNPRLVVDFPQYIDLARTAERGKFDLIFIADNLSVRELNPEPLSRVSDYIVQFEPITLLSAMAVVSKHIGLVATASTSYNAPFHVARKFASLDHISQGRAGWNLVTSSNDHEARNFGLKEHLPPDERYERASEFHDVVVGLWDSWEDDAFVRDQKSGRYCDSDKLHVLRHEGKYYAVHGPLNVARPPQGHPVIAQAGQSEPGRELAAKTADLVYSVLGSLENAQQFYADVKSRLKKYGRTERDLKIMPGVMPVVGRTEAEAKERFEELQSLVDPVVGMSQISAMFGSIDLSQYSPDDPLPEIARTNAFGSRAERIVEMARRENLTFRQLYLRIAARVHWYLVGSPEQIADELEHKFRSGCADGFNVMPPYIPGALNEFVDLVIPELQRRGLFRTEYEGTTLRENLGLRRPEHPARAARSGIEDRAGHGG